MYSVYACTQCMLVLSECLYSVYACTQCMLVLSICVHSVYASSAKQNSFRAEWLRQSGRTPSEPSETPQWRSTPRPASIQRVALYITLQSLFHCLFASYQSPILNDHSGVVANCGNTSECVHWVSACIQIAMRWVMLRISLLAFHLPARQMQFSLY
jgi:hypothetical protein